MESILNLWPFQPRLISPGKTSQEMEMMNHLSGPDVGHNLTVIIHSQTFWMLSQMYHYHSAIAFQQQLLSEPYISSASLFNRVLLLPCCTASWTERWVNSNKNKKNPVILRCLLTSLNLILPPPSGVSYPLESPSASCLSNSSSPLQVQSEIKRKWRRWMLQRFLGTDTKYQQPSIGSNGNNFSTQITMFTKCSPSTRRASAFQEHLSAIWDSRLLPISASVVVYWMCGPTVAMQLILVTESQ